MITISTIEAAQLAGSSINFIHIHIRKHSFLFKHIPFPRRLTYRINKASFEEFLRTYNPPHKKIGCAMSRASVRNPTKSKGYVHIYTPAHPRANFQGYVPEHVLIAEQKLNRPLTKKEEVHHINGIKLDNRPENLHVYASRSAHHKEGHGKAMSLRMKLIYLLRSKQLNLEALTIEAKANLFDSLVKEALAEIP